MKNRRIISGIAAAALAIVPFTGTGIDAVDNTLTKSTVITADAAYDDFTPGLYYVQKDFTGYTFYGNRPVSFRAGTYISVDNNCMSSGVKMLWYMHTHCGSDSEARKPHIVFVRR